MALKNRTVINLISDDEEEDPKKSPETKKNLLPGVSPESNELSGDENWKSTWLPNMHAHNICIEKMPGKLASSLSKSIESVTFRLNKNVTEISHSNQSVERKSDLSLDLSPQVVLTPVSTPVKWKLGHVTNIEIDTGNSGGSSAKTLQKKEPSVKKVHKSYKIKMLTQKLQSLEKHINMLAERDMSLKDMDSDENIYLQESRLKERYVHLWKRYCHLVGENPDDITNCRKKIRITSAPFCELNRTVEHYINKFDIFPNLLDIKQLCQKAMSQYDLNIRPSDFHYIAVDLFMEVGRKLQHRRQKDFQETAGNLLTDCVKIKDDPANDNPELKRKLKQNRKLAKQRIDHVFQDFVRQQFEQQAAGSGNQSSDDSEVELRQKKPLHRKISTVQHQNSATTVKKKKVCTEKTVISVTVSNDEPMSEKKINVIVGSPPGKMTGELKCNSAKKTDSNKQYVSQLKKRVKTDLLQTHSYVREEVPNQKSVMRSYSFSSNQSAQGETISCSTLVPCSTLTNANHLKSKSLNENMAVNRAKTDQRPNSYKYVSPLTIFRSKQQQSVNHDIVVLSSDDE